VIHMEKSGESSRFALPIIRFPKEFVIFLGCVSSQPRLPKSRDQRGAIFQGLLEITQLNCNDYLRENLIDDRPR
jgi:hypothetical protein